MKVRSQWKVAAVAAFALMILALPLVSQSQKADEAVETANYLLISPHTQEQCLAALDAILALPKGEEQLAMWDWGCMVGDHTGYMMTTATSEEEALKLVPEGMRKDAKAIKLNKFTAEQIKSFHEHE